MIADSTALGLDATWWTAIAAIIALGLGLWAIIGPPIIARIRRPKLELHFSELEHHSELIDDVFHLRLPVANGRDKISATDVEVFLLSIKQEHAPDPIQLPAYFPIRLIWAHGGLAVCDRIAGGAHRLLDLGQLSFAISSTTGFMEAVMARLEKTNPVLLGFNFEIIPTAGRIGLPVGTYTLSFLITCSEVATQQCVTVTVRNWHLADGETIGDYLHINKG